jgi:hypothetical protein
MSRRRWITAATVLVTPFLVFTLWAAVLLAYSAFQYECVRERYVENRTAGTIWIAPVGHGDHGPVALRHYPFRWPTYSGAATREIEIPSGESRRLFVDINHEMDVGGGCSILVCTASGDAFYLDAERNSPLVVEGHTKRYASTEAIDAASAPRRPTNFGIPFGVIVALGVLAPVALFRLSRAARQVRINQDDVGM